MTLDPRLTPARSDLAAAALRGRVEATRFVDGRRARVVASVLDLKASPRHDAPLLTQLLHGEDVDIYDEQEGWSWIQAAGDGYVGYAASDGLGPYGAAATHRVMVNRTFVYPAPDMKRPAAQALPLDARVALCATGDDQSYVELAGGGYVFSYHLAPVEQAALDYVAVAERLCGAPYLWGGKSSEGIDCSGLVQLAAGTAGRSMARDTDLQQADPTLRAVDPQDRLQRGDLVFWKGHVGIMCDAHELLHANAHHMLVARESLHAAQSRIQAATGLSPVAIGRFDGPG